MNSPQPAQPLDAPDISVSIASYNTCELLRVCLRALEARHQEGEARLQIIVADNGSTDGTLEMVEQEFPAVELLRTGGNIGYGRANNLAFERATAPYFCVLNSDAEVLPGALRLMRDWLESHPQSGMCGAQLLWPDGRPQASHGDDPQLLPVLWEQLYLEGVWKRLRALKPSSLEGESAEPREVEQLSGACLLLRREAYAQIGGFDPAFWMYVEDVDLCVRLRRAGWTIGWLPQARVTHHLGASSERDWQTRARMVSSYNRSRHLFFTRLGGPSWGRALKAMTVAGAALRLLIWTLAAVSHRPGAGDKVKLFREVLRRTWRMRQSSD